ncbi:Mini-circle protein [Kribbella sp. ALI-6-A]|uniref:DinB family protein n=1 Tax=Kribbella sp. ALI-6-A TaxID=1933817 RepID=UPI00097CA6DC|nr:DinB family protein [Kribbella sp. ALI-6-A]ONI67476.1 Mini-circle protein [Kribbella sp. ALI-6-A]
MLPDQTIGDPVELPLAWLDYYRDTVERKLTGLSDEELRTSRLPSGWSPLELLKHLVFMERRWLRWGFTAEQVEQPWGDSDAEKRWRLDQGDSLESLLAALRSGGEKTREIVSRVGAAEAAVTGVGVVGVGPLAVRAKEGGRFRAGEVKPTLGWILFHVLQEYARHVGQLDVVRELADGSTGE